MARRGYSSLHSRMWSWSNMTWIALSTTTRTQSVPETTFIKGRANLALDLLCISGARTMWIYLLRYVERDEAVQACGVVVVLPLIVWEAAPEK